MKKLFIGKLSFSTTETGLRDLFSQYEPLRSVKIISDKFNGESRGFGFIEIDDNTKANEAIQALNGSVLDGRTIEVSEARPQTGGSRGPGGSGYDGARGSRNGSQRSFNNNRF